MKFFSPRFALLFLIVLGPRIATSAAAALPTFDQDTCSNVDLINQEIIQLELAGSRWQMGQSICLNQENFKTILAEKETVSGPGFQRPSHFLLPNRKVEIVNQRWDDPLGQMTLSVRYLDQADQVVNDELTYRMNFGVRRAEKGCATLVSDLSSFVMREDCFKNAVSNAAKTSSKKLNRKISSQ
jgi:hypothetical protein